MASIFDAKLSNPVGKWVEYKGGVFQYWDKESRKNISLGDTLHIMPLFVHNGVTGFNEEMNKGFYSNEVNSLRDKLTIKCDGKTIIEGAWDDIKDAIKAKGGKFTKVVYSLLINKDRSVELVAFKFAGAGCGCWMNGIKEDDLNLLRVLKLEPNGTLKKGKTVYSIFKVGIGKRSDKYADLANSYGLTLQAYFNQYFSVEVEKQALNEDDINAEIATVLSEETVPAFDDKDGTETDDLPF